MSDLKFESQDSAIGLDHSSDTSQPSANAEPSSRSESVDGLSAGGDSGAALKSPSQSEATGTVSASEPSERMQCMEVWGGNQRADRHLETPGLEAWVYSEPHERAQGGGDVYYVSSCASGRITRLLLADVSGHGIDASGAAIGLRELMRRNVNMIHQTQFVRAMNKQFAESQSDKRFATALVCSYFRPTGRLSLCNAGHPEPLYLPHNGEWRSLAQDDANEELSDFPLGVVDDTAYTQFNLDLGTGDLLMLFSDAFIESADGKGGLLGSEGLLSLVQGLDASEPESLIAQLIEAMRAIDPNNLTDDDSTVLLIRSTGTKATIKNTLLAPLRLLMPVRDNTDLDGV